MIRAVEAVATTCPDGGVALASQRLLIEVLLQSENVGLMEYQLPELLEGHLGGNCAASWPSRIQVPPAEAHDTGRGWRMSGQLPALPNLDRNWFIVSMPVRFGPATPYSLVLLRSEEDGIIRTGGASSDSAGNSCMSLELRDVFLREDEILVSNAGETVKRLSVLSESMRAALAAGALRRHPNRGDSADPGTGVAALPDNSR